MGLPPPTPKVEGPVRQRKPVLPVPLTGPAASPLSPPQRYGRIGPAGTPITPGLGITPETAASAGLFGGLLGDYRTPLTGSTGMSRPSPKSASAVATPEQLRFYLDSFSSEAQQQGGTGGGLFGGLGEGAGGHWAPSSFSFAQQQMQDQQDPSSPALPVNQEAPRYRPSWLPRAKAVVHTPDVLSPSAPDEVEEFVGGLIPALSQGGDPQLQGAPASDLLDRWTENLREWFSGKVVGPLVEVVEGAHSAVNQYLQQYNQQIRLPAIPDVIGASNGGHAAMDIETLLRHAQAWCQALYQPNTQQGLHAMELAKALTRYDQLLQLLRGRRPADLLPPAPAGYVWSRVQALAEGTCMPAFHWNGGGSWMGRPWTPDLPNDSALVLYLFAAFIDAPGWEFSHKPADGDTSRGMPLFLGQLRTRPPNQYSAILSYRPEKPSKDVDAILALNQATTAPMMCMLAQGRILVLTGYNALFHVILLFLLFHKYKYNSALGMHFLQDHALGLAPVIELPELMPHVKHSVFGWWFPPTEAAAGGRAGLASRK